MRKKLILILLIIAGVLGAYDFSTMGIPIRTTDLNYKNFSKIKVKDPTKFSFVVLGDNKNSYGTFDRMIKDINKHADKVSFVMNTGDLVFDGDNLKYKLFLNQIKKLKVPHMVVPGNHDIYDEGVRLYHKIFGAFYYSFEVGKSLFIVLNDANEVRIDPQQLYWLKKRMKESWNYEHTFVFMHVPLFDPRPHEHHCLKDRKNAEEILSIFKEGKIDMVFCGHIHSHFRGNWDGVPYTITAGAGAELMGINPENYFYHYVVVDINGEAVTYSVVKFPTPPYDYPLRMSYVILFYILAFLRQQYIVILLILFLYISFRLYYEKGLIAFVKALIMKIAVDIKETSDKMKKR